MKRFLAADHTLGKPGGYSHRVRSAFDIYTLSTIESEEEGNGCIGKALISYLYARSLRHPCSFSVTGLGGSSS